jgi:hypothetical protein
MKDEHGEDGRCRKDAECDGMLCGSQYRLMFTVDRLHKSLWLRCSGQGKAWKLHSVLVLDHSRLSLRLSLREAKRAGINKCLYSATL